MNAQAITNYPIPGYPLKGRLRRDVELGSGDVNKMIVSAKATQSVTAPWKSVGLEV